MLDPLVSVQADNCQYFMDTRQDWLVFASKFPTEIFKGFGKLTKAGEGNENNVDLSIPFSITFKSKRRVA